MEAAKYYGQLYKKNESLEETLEMDLIYPRMESGLFDLQDFYEGVKSCNFKKGVGTDGFNGQVLTDDRVREGVGKWLVDSLNRGIVPQYLSEGRLVLLSKKNGE